MQSSLIPLLLLFWTVRASNTWFLLMLLYSLNFRFQFFIFYKHIAWWVYSYIMAFGLSFIYVLALRMGWLQWAPSHPVSALSFLLTVSVLSLKWVFDFLTGMYWYFPKECFSSFFFGQCFSFWLSVLVLSFFNFII